MNLTMLAQELAADEGKVLTVYHGTRDSQNVLTVGIGHRVVLMDDLALGQTIDEAMCVEFLVHDLQRAVLACQSIFPAFERLPEAVQHVLANMAFQLGYRGLSGFVHVIRAITAHDWHQAAQCGRDSLWYHQTPQRAERLMRRLEMVQD